ncbi:MAG: hypothetical protein KJO69_10770 [Gammaproteobacteria bacterium]|nr:hypothetical protein [Gammaproteobacteria bacterium]
MTMRRNLFINLLFVLFITGCSSLPVEDELEVIEPQTEAKVTESVTYNREATQLYQRANALRDKKPAEAVFLYKSAISADPSIEPAYFNLAKLYLMQKTYDEIASVITLAETNRIQSARLNNLNGMTLRQQGQFIPAKEYYLKALSIDSSHQASLVNMAILSDIYLQDLSTAMEYYLKYQATITNDDAAASQVKNWIADLQLRLNKLPGGAS